MHYTFTYKVLLENQQLSIKKIHFNFKHYKNVFHLLPILLNSKRKNENPTLQILNT